MISYNAKNIGPPQCLQGTPCMQPSLLHTQSIHCLLWKRDIWGHLRVLRHPAEDAAGPKGRAGDWHSRTKASSTGQAASTKMKVENLQVVVLCPEPGCPYVSAGSGTTELQAAVQGKDSLANNSHLTCKLLLWQHGAQSKLMCPAPCLEHWVQTVCAAWACWPVSMLKLVLNINTNGGDQRGYVQVERGSSS